MRRRALIILLLLAISAAPLSAQFVVIDPANLTQTILIAERTLDEYNQLRNEFAIVQQMARQLGSLDQYRIPAIGITSHDPSRWIYGRPWIQALDTGDPRGTAYYETAVPLQRPSDADLARLTPDARQEFEDRYATTEITDSVAIIGAHQVALVRDYSNKLQQATQNLEQDVLNPDPNYHQMTAVLDKISAGELLARRQDTMTNQLLSHALEQLLARSKRFRDTEAANANMQLVTWRDGAAANDAFIRGSGDALSTWRQP